MFQTISNLPGVKQIAGLFLGPKILMEGVPYGDIVLIRGGFEVYVNGKLAYRQQGGDHFWYDPETRRLSRQSGPAVILRDGHREWHHNGRLHRTEGPAIITSSGKELWWFEGESLQAGEVIKRNPDYPKGNVVLTEWGFKVDDPVTKQTIFQQFNGGSKHWYKSGFGHRDEGPAVIHPNGKMVWMKDGAIHNEQGPAVVNPGYSDQYWLNNVKISYEDWLFHVVTRKEEKSKDERSDIPAGQREKTEKGFLVRVDGEVVYAEYGTTRYWYKDGKHHREDGPAIIFSDGTKFWEYRGMLHRTNGPAIEFSSGAKEYWLSDRRYKFAAYQNAIMRLDDLKMEIIAKNPTVTGVMIDDKNRVEAQPIVASLQEKDPVGTWRKYLSHSLHCEDGPAVVYPNGRKEYWIHGVKQDRPVTKVILTDTGFTVWKDDQGAFHRIGGPAFITNNAEEWYQNGVLHREGGPAVIDNGKKTKEWYQKGQLHRTDGPAVVCEHEEVFYQKGKLTARKLMPRKNELVSDHMFERNDVQGVGKAVTGLLSTRKCWFKEVWFNAAGEIHREDGPAIVWGNGVEWWCQHSKLHREDGPALTSTDTIKWYKNDELHRIGGPAIEKSCDSEEALSYYLNGYKQSRPC
jgi:hypothetical protein